MSKKKNQQIPFWAKTGHAKPITRREMLASGVIPFSAWVIGPSIASILTPLNAMAQTNCAASGTSALIPFITLNLSGGPSLASQLAVKDLNGDNLPSYTKIGLGAGPGISFNVEKEFGGVEFSGTAIGGNTTGLVSKFLMGLRDPRNQGAAAVRSPALDKTAFVWSAVSLSDDTSANPLDVTGLVMKMGMQGSKLPNLGRSDTATGINQKSAMVPPPAPFVVGNVNDIANALGYTAQLTGLSVKQKTALAKVIGNMSGSQVRRIASSSGQQQLSNLVDCAGIRNEDLIATGGGDINPLALGNATATGLAGIWGITVNDRTSQNAVFASMVYNGLTGNAATINLNMGGYDYHDNTRTTGDTRDLAAGQVIGKILETANMLQKPVFIYVCADGATSSSESATADSVWMSDRGIAGMQYILAYHPTKRPVTSGSQIGGFNAGQAADGKFPTGNSADLAAQSIFANYAAWNGRTDFLETNRIAVDSDTRNKVIKLQKA